MTNHLETEAREILQQEAGKHCGYSEINWFLALMDVHHQDRWTQNDKPSLIVLGEDIPPEIAWALYPHARFLLGGSLETAHWSDSLLPRDAEPVSRSACGWLLNPFFNLAEDAVILLSLSNDNRRKLAGLLRENGLQVVTVDIPPRWDTPEGAEAWVSSMIRMTEEASALLRTGLTTRLLSKAMNEKAQIQLALEQFRETVLTHPSCMSHTLRIIIETSLWYADNRQEWLWHLRQLIGQIRSSGTLYYPNDSRPWVMLAGSPVIFPNMKLPLLLESAGMFLAEQADAVSLQMRFPCPKPRRFVSVRKLVEKIAETRLSGETAGGWIRNTGLLDSVQDTLERIPVEGIVYHVLKGQIEYDFELTRVEALASEYGVPVFRLETDYQQQDVEQLRIRMEAFAEMLRERGGERMRMAQ